MYPRLCDKCRETFNSKSSYYRHQKICGGEKSCITYPRKCICLKVFLNKFSYNKHKAGCEKTKNSERVSVTSCPEAECTFSHYYKYKVIEHLECHHLISSGLIHVTFEKINDFKIWMEVAVCSLTFSYFRKICGEKNGSSYYACQFNRKDTNKIPNYDCLSRILIKEHDSGIIDVKYYPNHSHELSFSNTQFQPFSESVINFIKQSILLGIPPKEITHQLRNGIGSEENKEFFPRKEYFIENKYVSNMRYKMKMKERYHCDDAVSVSIMIKNLVESDQEYNPIFIYKPQVGPVEVGPKQLGNLQNSEDLFALAIQKKRQFKMFQYGLQTVLCIDATHGTNRYDFKVLNIVARDQFGNGYLVCHFITNHLDSKVLEIFFKELKLKIPNQKINCIITDDDDALRKSIKNVFGNEVTSLLCTWHLFRTWKRQLSQKVSDYVLRERIYQNLLSLQKENNVNTFKALLSGFLVAFESSANNFIMYFEKEYTYRCEEWAMCYRNFPHGHTDTNMSVESFHNKLKTYYFDRCFNKRLDNLITKLLEIENDYFMANHYKVLLKKPEVSLSSAKDNNHFRGLKIPSQAVQAMEEFKWNIKSQSSPCMNYVVELRESECPIPDHCVAKCFEGCPNLCIHMYCCSCPVKSICKHIHKVHHDRLINSCVTTASENPTEIIPVKNILEVEGLEPKKRMEGKLILLKLEAVYDSVPAHMLNHVNSLLKNVLSVCTARFNNDEAMPSPPSMKPIIKISPNEKIQKQKLYKTTKNRYIRKPVFKNPTVEEVSDIKNQLLALGSTYSSINEDNTWDISKKEEQGRSDNVLECEFNFTREVRIMEKSNEELSKNSFQANGYSITLLELMSLDVFISNEEEKYLQSINNCFIRGWLYDSVIDGYISLLMQDITNFSYVNSSVSQVLSQGQFNSTYNPFYDCENNILIPYNSGNHWILLYIKTREAKVIVLDPMKTSGMCDHLQTVVKNTTDLIDLVSNSIKMKTWIIEDIPHVIQRDGYNCGVYICYYAERILTHKDLTCSFDTNLYRRQIYNAIIHS